MSAKFEMVAKRGRPPGSGNKVAKFRNWQPKQWKLDYETVLLLHVSGKTNKEIAVLTQFHEVHIGNILNCTLARVRLAEIRDKLGIRELTDDFSYIVQKGTNRLKDFIDNDDLYKNAPLAAIDRTMKVMEMLDSKLRVRDSSEGKGNTTVNILASQASVDKLLAANSFSDQIKGLKRIAEIDGK